MKTSKRLLNKALALFLVAVTILGIPAVLASSNIGISSPLALTAEAANMSLADLISKFPEGKYWNHYCSSQTDTSNYCRDKGLNCYDNSVSSTPCWSHSAGGYSAYVGHYDCNRYSGATQCCGFAKKISSLAYGSVCTSWSTKSLSQGLKRGDVIWYNTSSSYGHWVTIVNVNGNQITVGECNYGGRCLISWSRTINVNNLSIKRIYNAPSELPSSNHTHVWTGARVYESAHPHRISQRCRDYATCGGFYWTDQYYKVSSCSQCNPASRTYYLDVNSYLDGKYRGDISGIATCDVYINGKLVADNCTDFYRQYKAGTKYRICDIRTKSGYKYNGNSSYSGTINSLVNINLSFSSSYANTSFKVKSAARIQAYSDPACTTKSGFVYVGDWLTVKRLYESSQVIFCSCPWQNAAGVKDIYIKISQLQITMTQYTNCYSSATLANYQGRAYPQDKITSIRIVRNSNSKIVLSGYCPWTNGQKYVYMSSSVY